MCIQRHCVDNVCRVSAVSTLSFKLVMLMRQVVLAGVLHHKMMARVLRAPLVFFDRTPVGRIVARFSQVSVGLPLKTGDVLCVSCVFQPSSGACSKSSFVKTAEVS